MKWNDPEKITKVTDSKDYFDVQCGSLGFGLEKKYGCTPKVGDTLEIKSRGGMEVAGVKINGEVIFEKSEAELEKEREEWKLKHEADKKAEFEKNKAEHDAAYDGLPPIFKKRIDRLRRNNPNFRWDVEPYDVFACKEGIKIAEGCKTLEALQKFQDMNHDEQMKLVGMDPGHSGGTFGQAMMIARCLIEGNERYIPFIHSSLAQIAGCESIGCIPPTEAEKLEYGFDNA